MSWGLFSTDGVALAVILYSPLNVAIASRHLRSRFWVRYLSALSNVAFFSLLGVRVAKTLNRFRQKTMPWVLPEEGSEEVS